jgi:glycosyltransferase involved in cell wall biosynthesis
MDCSDFIEKISIVPLAVSPKTFARLDHTGARFLFVGSIDRRAFEAKGGKEILEAFRVLLRRHENIKLSMRIECPISIKQQYADVLSDSRVELIDYHIAEERLARLYSSADVFLMPAHDTPFRSILEAMSYELPVLTIDKQANGELVQNGVTGYVIKPRSQQMKFYWEDYMKTGVLPRRSLYDEAVHALNPDVVEQLVELSSKLVDNPTLRMSMGRAARREIEVGRFSVANRNCILKTIFDRALSNS